MEARRRYRGAETAQQRERVEVDGDGAVGEGLLETDAHQTVGTARDALLRDRGTEDVLQESLAAQLVEATRARCGGKKPDHGQVEEQPPKPSYGEDEKKEKKDGPEMDGQALVQQMKEMAEAAKNTAKHLWPLLLLFLLYRPAKRALLKTHLLTPIVPAPPTERIDNNWEYVRIAAGDAGVVPAPSDSVEQLLTRIREKGLGGAGLQNAAAIYTRTRYGFVVGRGDAIAMRRHAIAAARELQVKVTPWQRFTNAFRRLS